MGEKKSDGPKFEGFSLEMDVMRKMARQLERLKTPEARQRAASYVASASVEPAATEVLRGTRPDEELLRLVGE